MPAKKPSAKRAPQAAKKSAKKVTLADMPATRGAAKAVRGGKVSRVEPINIKQTVVTD